MTHKLKFLLLSMMTVISLSIFTSCETDEDIGYGLSGAFGKTWYGDFGSVDGYGEPVYSEIMFLSGRSDSYGSGWERTYYYDGYPAYSDTFDWEVINGVIYLYYQLQGEWRIYDYHITHDTFRGYKGDFYFQLHLDY